MLNDLAWLTFTILVPYLIAQCLLLALAIYWDRQDQPVFKPWVAHFNLLIAAALAPAAFTALASTGPLRLGRRCCRSGSRTLRSPYGSSSWESFSARRFGSSARRSWSPHEYIDSASATMPDPPSGSG